MDLSPPEHLYVRTVVAIVERSENWLAWLSAAARGLRANPAAWPDVERTATVTSELLPVNRGALVHATMAFCVGHWSEVLERLDQWLPDTGSIEPAVNEGFIAYFLRSRGADELNRPDAYKALFNAIRCVADGTTDEVLANADILGSAVTLQLLLDQYVSFVVASGETGRAIALLGELRDEHPDRLELRLCLADLMIKSKRVGEGVHELRDIARHYERRGDFSQMVTAMRRMSQAVPNNVEIKAMVVDVYVQRGVLDEALVELQALAELYDRSGRLDDAVRSLTRAAEIAYATSSFALGQDLFDRATEINPDDVPVRHAAVAFFLQTGAVQRATDQLRQVVRIALDHRDPDEAVAALHQIIGLAPHDTDAYHRLGEVLTTMGEYGQAERVYRRLAALAPGDPVLQAKQSALAVLAATQ
jgi:tetratricopeptide (TPR) repeat protein